MFKQNYGHAFALYFLIYMWVKLHLKYHVIYAT